MKHSVIAVAVIFAVSAPAFANLTFGGTTNYTGTSQVAANYAYGNSYMNARSAQLGAIATPNPKQQLPTQKVPTSTLSPQLTPPTPQPQPINTPPVQQLIPPTPATLLNPQVPQPVTPPVIQQTPVAPTPNAIPPVQQRVPQPVIPAVIQRTPVAPTPNAIPPVQQRVPPVRQSVPVTPVPPMTVVTNAKQTPAAMIPNPTLQTIPAPLPPVVVTTAQVVPVTITPVTTSQVVPATQITTTGGTTPPVITTNNGSVTPTTTPVQPTTIPVQTTQQIVQRAAPNYATQQQVNQLQQDTNKQFASLKNEVDGNRQRASAGTATALAAAGIPQVMADQQFSVGAATGGYDGEQAIAVGFSARVNDNVVVKSSVGADTQHEAGYNVGVAIGW